MPSAWSQALAAAQGRSYAIIPSVVVADRHPALGLRSPWPAAKYIGTQFRLVLATAVPRNMRTSSSLGLLLPFMRSHRREFTYGCVAAIGVVILRLSLPWPLMRLIAPWFSDAQGSAPAASPEAASAVLVMGGTFLLLAVALGRADLAERVAFARFAIGVVRDLRSAVFETTRRKGQVVRVAGIGDLIARLVGDTARIKTGIKGFLIHVATNSLLFAGVGVVFFWLHPPLGLIFCVAGMLLMAMTYVAATRIYGRAAAYRKKEGKLAQAIHESSSLEREAASFATVNKSSGRHEAALTLLQGRATWGAHALFGVTVLVALWISWHSVQRGDLDAEVLLLVALYSLTLRTPMVQLVRQGCRTGKILAGLDRLVLLLGQTEAPDDRRAAPGPLTDCLSLRRVRIRARLVRRLGPVDLDIPAGQHVALLGGRAAGKTTLLRIIAGLETAWKGTLCWDGQPMPSLRLSTASSAFLPDLPDWPRMALRDYLRVTENPSDDVTARVFALCKVDKVAGRLPRGLETKLQGAELSQSERKAMTLARTLLCRASVLLLDDPFVEHRARKRHGLLASVLEIAGQSTVLVALSTPTDLASFDRVVVLKRGRVVFDGTPDAWRAHRAGRDAAEVSAPLAAELSPQPTRRVGS